MEQTIPLSEFDTTPIEREVFVVDNDAKADWALRKLGAIRAKIEENKALALAEIERVNAWLEQANASFAGDIAYFEAQLTNYGATQRLEGRKSVDLPHGKIKSRAVGAKFAVEDKEAFLEWARANAPELIRISEAPAVSEMNAALTKSDAGVAVSAAGEVVPGVSVLDATIAYTFETP